MKKVLLLLQMYSCIVLGQSNKMINLDDLDQIKIDSTSHIFITNKGSITVLDSCWIISTQEYKKFLAQKNWIEKSSDLNILTMSYIDNINSNYDEVVSNFNKLKVKSDSLIENAIPRLDSSITNLDIANSNLEVTRTKIDNAIANIKVEKYKRIYYLLGGIISGFVVGYALN